ncbi:GNAT family protein [Flammeovirga pacifica]|uniref:N-end rule aminoacyl transferase C-terminal domain-containing protein n=1 Tax=Flammeovirga pacifica TaxID=915059 RepID=A0A1S1YXU5_FLAPC|nr:hypothetical protein [Flammeovirga pacifica]OHX65810.1 hypothetical protein NH26_05320 [Flammeovirga pacifica]
MYYDLAFGIVSSQEKKLTPVEIDQLLAKGYFRHSLNMASYEMMYFDDKMQGVLPLRCRMQENMLSKSSRKKIRQIKNKFNVVIEPLNLTEAHKKLFTDYRKERFDEEEKSLLHYFGVDSDQDLPLIPFDTYQVSFYLDNQLAAASFFDVGDKALSSLMAIYDKDFKEYGLGYISMLFEIEWAQEQQMEFYYPGYTLDMPSCFDYKLRLPNVEFFDWNNEWLTWDNIDLKSTKRYKTLHSINHIIEEVNNLCIVKGKVAEEQNFFSSMWHDMFEFTQAVEAPIYASYPIGSYHQMIIIYLPDEDTFLVKPHLFKFDSGLPESLKTNNPEDIALFIGAYFAHLQLIDVRLTTALDNFLAILKGSNIEFDVVETLGNAARHPNYKWISLRKEDSQWMVMPLWDEKKKMYLFHPMIFKHDQNRWVSPFGLCSDAIAILKISDYICSKEDNWHNLLSEND